jgi:GGDEF domain-containing protein
MTIEELILLCNLQRDTQISPLQEWILREAWEGKTYGAMALKSNYVEEYLRRTAANLWSKLSQELNDNVTKYNLRKLVEKRPLTLAQKQLIRQNQQQQQEQLPSPPGQTLPLGSLFYLEHFALEAGMRNSLTKGNCLLRIQGAPKFGKTSFLQRVINYGKELQYDCISVSCKDIAYEVNSDDANNPQVYIAALNQRIHRTLVQHNQPFGDDCTTLVERDLRHEQQNFDSWRYQLGDTALLLVITDLDQLLNQPLIGQVLRSTIEEWHHQANTLPEYAGLSIVVTYTVEQAHHPWQYGVKLTMPALTLEQVQELARRYGLTESTPVQFNAEHGRLLYEYVGGHPFLVQQALYELWLQGKSCPAVGQFTPWLQQAGRQNGCFGEYMRSLWLQINSVPHWQKVLSLIPTGKATRATATELKLPYEATYELISLAILHQDQGPDQPVQWRCQLYEDVLGHLAQLNAELNIAPLAPETANDAKENGEPNIAISPQLGSYGGEVTGLVMESQVSAQPYAQPKAQQISLMWQDGIIHKMALAAILCQVDYYHTYRKIYGEAAAKDCLHRISQVLRECLDTHLDYSYGQLAIVYPQDGERFLMVLSNTETYAAYCLATNLRANVKALNISTNSVMLQVGGFPDSVMTISIGVASVLPTEALQPSYLLDLAQQGLDQANSEGGDRICIGGTTDETDL